MIYLFGARVVGPLEPYVVGYCECLSGLGFTEAARAQHMSLVAHLSRWLVGERHDAGDLTERVPRHRPPAAAVRQQQDQQDCVQAGLR